MRINQQDMCQTDTMPFHQHWEARTEYSLSDVMNESRFFSEFRNALHIGDRITLIEYDKTGDRGADSEGVRGIIVLRVTDIDRTTGVIFYLVESDFVEVVEPEEEATPDGEGLELKRIFPEDGYSYVAEDSNGNVVERFATKTEGEQYVNVGE